jgi:hypothetical protein
LTTPKKKNQHFVPQFILRNFSGDHRSIGTFVLESGRRIDTASIADQCAQDYFYGRDPQMEEAFGTSEGDVASILRSFSSDKQAEFAGPYMIRRFPVTEEWDLIRAHPLYRLREFVYYQRHRTLASMEGMSDAIDAAVKHYVRRDPYFAETNPELIEALDHVRITRTNTMADILYHAGPFSCVTFDLAVKFIVTDEPSFIICDHPVVLRNHYSEVFPGGPGALGMPARGLQMFMPVSPHMVIAVYDPLVYDYGSPSSFVVRIGRMNAMRLNAMQAENAHECIYFDRRTAPDFSALRDRWIRRPEQTTRIVDGPITDRGDGTFTQLTKYLAPATTASAPLTFVRVNDRTTEDTRLSAGDEPSFPVRSLELLQSAHEFSAYIDWKVKQSVEEGGLPVHPHWQDWLDSVQDPQLA